MTSLQTLFTALACLTLYIAYRCEGSMLPCKPCTGIECDVEPENCRYGVVKNFCGRKVCAKGIRKRCGGLLDIEGKCGDGMQCKCRRCTGCSLHTLECDNSGSPCLADTADRLFDRLLMASDQY